MCGDVECLLKCVEVKGLNVVVVIIVVVVVEEEEVYELVEVCCCCGVSFVVVYGEVCEAYGLVLEDAEEGAKEGVVGGAFVELLGPFLSFFCILCLCVLVCLLLLWCESCPLCAYEGEFEHAQVHEEEVVCGPLLESVCVLLCVDGGVDALNSKEQIIFL